MPRLLRQCLDRKAYADWANTGFGRYQPALANNGVDLVQIAHQGIAGKNAADIRMAVDAMEVLITHPDVDVFILVTGDSDYSPLVHRLREFGKHVVGVGTEANASQRLVSVCSEYKFWGTIVADVDPSARPAVSAAFDIADAEALLVRAFEQIPADTPTRWHSQEQDDRTRPIIRPGELRLPHLPPLPQPTASPGHDRRPVR